MSGIVKSIELLGEYCNKSSKGAHFAFCTLCDKSLSISSGEITYLKRHAQSKALGMPLMCELRIKLSLHTFGPKPLDEKVSKAEMLWFLFSVEHQLLFKISDHATVCLLKCFQIHKLLQNCRVGEQKQKQWFAMLWQMG